MPIPSRSIRRWTLPLAAVLVLSACAATETARQPSGAAVAIMVAAPGVEVGLSRSRMTRLLEQAHADAGRLALVPASMVSVALGEAVLTGIGDELGDHAALSQASRNRLMAMPIPVDRALLVRLERNDTEVLEPSLEPALGVDGRALDDRDTVVLSHRRTMRVAAALIDLDSGSPLWQRAWDASPVASLKYVNYSGSSFAASVAATLANTVVGGLQGPNAPPAVGEQETLQALFGEVVQAMPPR